MSDALVSELEGFYARYLDAFNNGRSEGFTASFDYPNAMITADRGLLVQADEAATGGFLDVAISGLRGRGWDHSEVDRIQVWPFGADVAMIIADIARYRTDGTVFDRGRACYMLRRRDEGWKIMTFGEMKPPYSEAGIQIR